MAGGDERPRAVAGAAGDDPAERCDDAARREDVEDAEDEAHASLGTLFEKSDASEIRVTADRIVASSVFTATYAM